MVGGNKYFQFVSLNKPNKTFNVSKLLFVEVNGHFHCICQVSKRRRLQSFIYMLPESCVCVSELDFTVFRKLAQWEGWSGDTSPQVEHPPLLRKVSTFTQGIIEKREAYAINVKAAKKALHSQYRGYRGYLYKSLEYFNYSWAVCELQCLYQKKKSDINAAILGNLPVPSISKEEVEFIMKSKKGRAKKKSRD